jgi:APA family basic amino acid/polyamine antiporter
MNSQKSEKKKGKKEISESGLVKQIGLLDAVLFVMGSVLGSGIFMTSGHIIRYVGSEKWMLFIWLFGGLFTLCGGLCMAKLGVIYPKAGGPYVYLREAYGQWAGFLFGWIFFWIIESGGIAALSVGFTDHILSLAKIENIILAKIKLFSLLDVEINLSQLMAIFPILILSAINNYGIKLAIFIQNISMFIRVILIIVLVGFGYFILSKKGLVSLDQIDSIKVGAGFEGYFLAMLATLWTYDGWYAANCTAEEMKNPERDLPRAIILGIAGITAIYLLVNSVYVFALKAGNMAGEDRIGEIVSRIIFGEKAGPLITAGIALVIFGCLCATIIYGPRVYFAMARDRVFFARLGKLNEKTRVPSQAIWIQACLSSVLCLLGKFQSLYEYVVFSLIVFFAGLGLAVFKEKGKLKDNHLREKIRLESLILLAASVFILSCLIIYLSCFFWKTKEVLLGLVITLSGLPAYFYWKKKEKIR